MQRCHLQPPEQPEPLRLIVSLADQVTQTIKSVVPAVLHHYLDKLDLPSSGIRVVTISDPDILAEVRRILERQPGAHARTHACMCIRIVACKGVTHLQWKSLAVLAARIMHVCCLRTTSFPILYL